MRKPYLSFLLAWSLSLPSLAQSTNTSPAPASPSTVVQLGHGVNMGNALEAPAEGAWGVTLQAEYFSLIKQAGFTTIRVPVRWSIRVSPSPEYTIDPKFLARVDWVIAQAKQNHLQVILNDHNDEELIRSPDAFEPRFLKIWKQISEHFKDEPDSVLFELLNEPNGQIDATHWNLMLPRVLKIIRATNPTRTIVIGPAHWNNPDNLANLILPEDDHNILVTIHYYDPMTFTHQGAEWIEGSSKWLGTKWEGTDEEKLAITQAFDRAAAWGVAHNRPMYLGEFGAYSRGDMESRARWTAFVARTAEAHGMPWTYWEFCSTFGVYDPVSKQWRQPLLKALMP